MDKESSQPRRGKTAAAVIAFYAFLTALFLPQVYFYNAGAARPVPWSLAVGRIALANFVWAALTPLVFWLGSRFPVERPKLSRNLVLHFLFSLLLASAHALLYHLLLGLYLGHAFEMTVGFVRSVPVFLNYVTNGFVFYVAILAFHQALIYSRKYREREFRLQQAQLQVLRMQLHPHFLFNTLNAVSALVYENPRAAARVIAQLSDLLRLSLRGGQAQQIALKDELDFLRKYVEIQQTLLHDRLEVGWDIAPETLDARVPAMVLQPLVENSIRHGIAPLEAGGRVEVSARREGGALLLRVSDDGAGLPGADGLNGGAASNGGVGLANTRARLAQLYGAAHRFELRRQPAGGTAVSLTIPFREGADGAGGDDESAHADR
ncbi:MAG TPA: histidine kinase [Pyrinomonadaceae bacterium]|jgi:sensor histidine kinase YesM|nr:histidine kinase [Pyrinomonadaceae bacterium]